MLWRPWPLTSEPEARLRLRWSSIIRWPSKCIPRKFGAKSSVETEIIKGYLILASIWPQVLLDFEETIENTEKIISDEIILDKFGIFHIKEAPKNFQPFSWNLPFPNLIDTLYRVSRQVWNQGSCAKNPPPKIMIDASLGSPRSVPKHPTRNPFQKHSY